MQLSVTLPAVYSDATLFDAIDAAGELDVDGVEFFDWMDYDADEVREACADAGLTVAGTLARGGGRTIEGGDFALTDPDTRDTVVDDIEASVEAAADLDASSLIVTVGPEQEGLDRETQRESIVEVLSAVAPAAEAADVTIAVEPLNVAVDHPGYYLTDAEEAFDIVETVDSDHVTVLYDVYHQQVTEGNIIETVRENVDHIGHVHIADVPGRHQPGTGELNYENILAALNQAGYDGFVGCEFFPTDEPDDAVRSVVDLVR